MVIRMNGKGFAVNLREAQLADGLLVEAGAVAFVTGEAVARVLAVGDAHERIPGGLGQDGGAGYTEGELVPFDEGGLGEVEVGENEVIGKKVIRMERGESRELRGIRN